MQTRLGDGQSWDVGRGRHAAGLRVFLAFSRTPVPHLLVEVGEALGTPQTSVIRLWVQSPTLLYTFLCPSSSGRGVGTTSSTASGQEDYLNSPVRVSLLPVV